MKRNFLLLIILIAVSVVAFIVWNKRDVTESTSIRTASNFKIDNVNTIGKIILTSKDGNRSVLERQTDHWTINGQHRARQTNIDNLLRVINRQQMDHIPTQAATENILPSMAVNAIHVEIYDVAGEKMLGYYVGGVTPDERGTYFLKEGTSQPYGLVDPGFDGGLRARYALRPIDWRDVRFWMEENDEIDTLKVHYPKQRQHSFVIFKQGSGYEVIPMFVTTPKKGKANQARVESYFTTLSKLACENFITNAVEKDSIIRSVAFMEMDIVYPGKKSYLNFYPIVLPVKTQFSTDVPRYYIDYSGNDFMVGQHEVLKGAFRSYEFFFD